ncbi:hypothetical protein Clacol_000291 [Clathrus columnatus]|uniref:Lysophospholipase n=1 Tax=Clathrus columnatus TaxID=1419009 RepID=A0AAV4ZYF7_9AGAM|nr:hypothetical protein Clacol_000291 [Clathrus columnatus]
MISKEYSILFPEIRRRMYFKSHNWLLARCYRPGCAPKTPIPSKEDSKEESNNTLSSWNNARLDFLTTSLPINNISQILSSWTWSPSLHLTGLQDKLSALFLELGLGPGSLYSEIIKENPDILIHPECEWDAEVRLGDDLCLSEQAFLRERKRKMRKAFAEFIGVPINEVHEDDIPIVAIAGSGGGFRAMLNTIGSLSACNSTRLLDCVTYTAGISGSCWALGTIYSGVAGSTNPVDAGQHVKDRIKLSYLDMATLEALVTPPTNKYLLSGFLRKAAGEASSVSLVDLYGTFVSSRIFVPSNMDKLDIRQMSLYRFREKVDDGSLPLPIFTALQHVIISPDDKTTIGFRKTSESRPTKNSLQKIIANQLETLTPSRWLWYEFTPYEVGCDELGAWIPSWALGRPFINGKNLDRRPEMSFMILSGIFASAFCASLKHYFAEIRPALRVLPNQLYQWLEDIITENEKDLGLIHPVLPSKVPNFMKGLTGLLRTGSPEDITTADTLGFFDAGAELNIPYYPLLRRNVDCVIALDASADSQDLWFKRAEAHGASELAVKRGLRTWPRGTGWPTRLSGVSQKDTEEIIAKNPETANAALAQQQEAEVLQQTERKFGEDAITSSSKSSLKQQSSCEVWIGTTRTNGSESSRLDDLEEEDLYQRDGIGIVYIPLVPNIKIPDFDPSSISTWRREVLPNESQNLLDTAEANMTEGIPKIKKVLKAMWKRKRAERTTREQKGMNRFTA